MSNVQTNAPSPAQPVTAFYPQSALQLFPSITRAQYLAKFSTDAPTYDSTKKPKDWFDPTLTGAPTDIVTYNFIDTSTPGKPVIGTISMTVAEASAVNIPGVHSYPQYVPAPTVATENVLGAPQQPIPANQLASHADALAIATDWGCAPSCVTEWTPQAIVFNWGTETRRIYLIMYNGVQLNAGQYLGIMNANGVGAPGHWVFTGPQPTWVSLLPASVPVVLQPWPEPVRALLPNEALFSGLFAGVVVYRMDMPSQYNVAGGGASPSAGPDYTAQLNRMEAGLQRIESVLGVLSVTSTTQGA
jgi:hypothetical protein